MRRILRLAVLALVVSVVWVAAREAPASARRRHRQPPATVLNIADKAPLSADGQTADVFVSIRCSGSPPSPVNVTLRQRTTTGEGHSSTAYKCDRRTHRLVVPVTVTSGDGFRKGTASVSASVTLHPSGGSSSTGYSRGIELT